MNVTELTVRTVTIPATREHNGWAATTVTLIWECPVCGGPRGDVFKTVSYDGSRRLYCDGWRNPCGHVDSYAAVRREAGRERTNRHDRR